MAFIAFASPDKLADLATADRIYCDGTFYTCPAIFHQIYTIHTQTNGLLQPVVYALLPGKSQQLYTRFFSLLKAALTNRHLPFTVEDVWFNSLQDLEDADLPVHTTPFTDYVVTQWIDGDRTL